MRALGTLKTMGTSPHNWGVFAQCHALLPLSYIPVPVQPPQGPQPASAGPSPRCQAGWGSWHLFWTKRSHSQSSQESEAQKDKGFSLYAWELGPSNHLWTLPNFFSTYPDASLEWGVRHILCNIRGWPYLPHSCPDYCMIRGLCGPGLPYPVHLPAATVIFLSLGSDYAPSLILKQSQKNI